MNTTHISSLTAGMLIAGISLIATVAFMSTPAKAEAASYGYIDTAGYVRSVVADNWMTAIAIAPGITLHSGVMLLRSTADFNLVGKHSSNI